MEFTPWERYPALTIERLMILGGALREGRNSAVEDYKPHKGDTTWNLGCTAYTRSCFQVEMAAGSHSWLTILPEENNRFTFAVLGVPLKFYHGFGRGSKEVRHREGGQDSGTPVGDQTQSTEQSVSSMRDDERSF